MSKFFFVMLVCVFYAQADIIGHVVPDDHPNYKAQLPPDLNNNTGISLSNLLIENPQNSFAFTSQTDSGPRNLIGYFDPILPALQVIWTTPYVMWVAPEEPEPIIIPPPPPLPPPPGCEVTGTCPPLFPPLGCEVIGTCPPLPPPPPPTEVPEPQMWALMVAGILLIYACRPRPRAH